MLLVGEFTLRVFQIGRTDASVYLFDEQTGSRLIPNHSFWQTSEGSVLVTTNQHGLRDYPHPQRKPEGTFRIAVIGDSFAEAFQVETDDTFWNVAERHLNDCRYAGDRQIECLNFGVSGHGTAQQLMMLRHYVWDFEPDMILLAFFPGNDLRNNSRSLEPNKQRPFFHLCDEQLVLDTSGLEMPEIHAFKNSRWLQFKDSLIRHCRILGTVYQIKNRWQATDSNSTEQSQSTAIGEIGLDAEIFAEPKGAWAEAWKLTERLLIEISQEASRRNATFAVLVIPSSIVADPDPGVRQTYMDQFGVDDLFYPDMRIVELGAASGFHVTPLGLAMQEIAEAEGEYLYGFANAEIGRGHWNRQGHDVAGRLLARQLCEKK